MVKELLFSGISELGLCLGGFDGRVGALNHPLLLLLPWEFSAAFTFALLRRMPPCALKCHMPFLVSVYLRQGRSTVISKQKPHFGAEQRDQQRWL